MGPSAVGAYLPRHTGAKRSTLAQTEITLKVLIVQGSFEYEDTIWGAVSSA